MQVGWFSEADCDLDAFKSEIDGLRDAWDGAPCAVEVVKDVPIYDCAALRAGRNGANSDRELMREWAGIFANGPGVLVLRGAVPDTAVVDAATAVFAAILDDQRESGDGGGDHFGTNDRIWNSLEKLCLRAPDVFAAYHGNIILDLAARAWLGPNYQMTAQVNLVHPGGEPQQAHRDYHLGFQTNDVAKDYPIAAHLFSPQLTLQGGIAHCDMPIEAGPTQFLPFSQTYAPGYLAYRLPAFQDYANDYFVQLPLQKGDAIFFNPAMYHAAGGNRSAEIERLANLFQVSSAFGRAMESIDRHAMCLALYPSLSDKKASGALDDESIDAAIAAAAEGYSFPTNLDSDPPIGGLAPKTQADLMREGLAKGWPLGMLKAELDALEERRRP